VQQGFEVLMPGSQHHARVDKLHVEGNWIEMPAMELEQNFDNYPEFIEQIRRSSKTQDKAISSSCRGLDLMGISPITTDQPATQPQSHPPISPPAPIPIPAPSVTIGS
jgi:hypothetical protein